MAPYARGRSWIDADPFESPARCMFESVDTRRVPELGGLPLVRGLVLRGLALHALRGFHEPLVFLDLLPLSFRNRRSCSTQIALSCRCFARLSFTRLISVLCVPLCTMQGSRSRLSQLTTRRVFAEVFSADPKATFSRDERGVRLCGRGRFDVQTGPFVRKPDTLRSKLDNPRDERIVRRNAKSDRVWRSPSAAGWVGVRPLPQVVRHRPVTHIAQVCCRRSIEYFVDPKPRGRFA